MELCSLLANLDIHPILVDVGASIGPPEIWESLASQSVYVGFDPDLRDIAEISDGRFRRSIIVNEAVTDLHKENIPFYLTHSPYCSSTLKPDRASLSNYLFAPLFEIEQEVVVKATTLNEVLRRLELAGIDWLKCDTQGTDLRIFMSLEPDIRSRVLAVDLEPGLIDAYQGEDTFVNVHRGMMRAGFWPSNLNVVGTIRMRPSTLEQANEYTARQLERIAAYAPKAPGWCEVRYLRTLESLTESASGEREYVLLWVFAMLDHQPGFAFDIAVEYKRLFQNEDIAGLLIRATRANLESALWQSRIRGWMDLLQNRLTRLLSQPRIRI